MQTQTARPRERDFLNAGNLTNDRTAPPGIALAAVGIFCGTVATIGGGTWVGGEVGDAPALRATINPVLFIVGFTLGAAMLRGIFRGKMPSLAAWGVGWAAFWLVLWVVATWTDRSYQGWGVLFDVLAFVLALPVGMLFGGTLMFATRTLATQLHRVWLATGDAGRLARESAGWLLLAATAKWLTQPVSLHGMSAVVGLGAAAWLAGRGGRWALSGFAALLTALVVTVKVIPAREELRQKRHSALPPCAEALEAAAARVPGVSRASAVVMESTEPGPPESPLVPGPTITVQRIDVLVYAAPEDVAPTALHDRVDRALRGVACRDNDAEYQERMEHTVTVEPAACWSALEAAVRDAAGGATFQVFVGHANLGADAGPGLVESLTFDVQLKTRPDASSPSDLRARVEEALKPLPCTEPQDPGFHARVAYRVFIDS